MSIVEVTMYAAECDGCRADLTHNDDYAAWADRGTVMEMLPTEDYYVSGEFILCDSCAEEAREVLGDDEARWPLLHVKAWATGHGRGGR